MFNHPIQVLDSHLRFTNLLEAAGALGAIGRASVDPVIAGRGQLVANFWRCGWDVTAAEDGASFRLQFTRAPLESWEVSYEALRAVAPFVVTAASCSSPATTDLFSRFASPTKSPSSSAAGSRSSRTAPTRSRQGAGTS